MDNDNQNENNLPNSLNINNEGMSFNQNNPNTQTDDDNQQDENKLLFKGQQNQFINYEATQNETTLDNLNVKDDYYKLEKPDYTNNPVVKQNIEQYEKKTVPVSKELKTVIAIALILLIFIIFMPMIFDFLNDIRFN